MLWTDIIQLQEESSEIGFFSLHIMHNFALEYAMRRVQEKQEDWNQTGHISFWPMLMTLIFWEKT
jgi:hypothetical protein